MDQTKKQARKQAKAKAKSQTKSIVLSRTSNDMVVRCAADASITDGVTTTDLSAGGIDDVMDVFSPQFDPGPPFDVQGLEYHEDDCYPEQSWEEAEAEQFQPEELWDPPTLPDLDPETDPVAGPEVVIDTVTPPSSEPGPGTAIMLSEAAAYRDVTDERFQEEASRILKAPNLLDLFVRDVHAAGVVGEEDNIKLLKLVDVSRILENPLGAIVKGHAGSGKSTLVRTVLSFGDQDLVLSATDITRQELTFSGSVLDGKVVFIGEGEGADRAARQLRQLFSDGALVTRSPTGLRMAEARFAFVTTTARPHLDRELEDRMLELAIDESAEQTEAIIDALLAEHAITKPDAEESGRRQVWRLVCSALHPRPVIVPTQVWTNHRRRIPRGHAARRFTQRLLGVTMAHALLHQQQRAVSENGAIIGTQTDADVAVRLVMGPESPLPQRVRCLHRLLADAYPSQDFTVAVAAYKLGRIDDVLRREVKTLAEFGLVEEVARGRGRASARWRVVMPAEIAVPGGEGAV